METVEITIERRSEQGKGAARRLRAAGRVPGILYGPKRTTTSITVAAEEFEKKVAHLEGAHLIRLVHAASDAELHEKMVLVREMQMHPVSGHALHADFYEVDLTERLTVEVTIHFVGKAVGVVNGGILQPILREIEVECLPTEIPEHIDVDITDLALNEAIRVRDLAVGPKWKPISDADTMIVHVVAIKVEEPAATEAVAAPAATPAEPEVIKKGKTDKEEEPKK